MNLLKNFPAFLHGGDYNPDQWLRTPEIIDEDFRLMDKARCNTFSIGIFSWSQYEPEEGKFDFSWLDDIMERCRIHEKKVFLATPSAARPAWLAHKYPETNRVSAEGVRQPWGIRENHCWSSPVMRTKLALIIRKLAERYAAHPALAGWHISNEYNGACHCPLCRKEFVDFLKQRYGSLEHLNELYWSAFWGHRYTAWEQVDPNDSAMDLAMLDFQRFNTQQVLDFMRFEIEALKEYNHPELVASTFSTADNRMVPGINASGPRIITFAASSRCSAMLLSMTRTRSSPPKSRPWPRRKRSTAWSPYAPAPAWPPYSGTWAWTASSPAVRP